MSASNFTGVTIVKVLQTGNGRNLGLRFGVEPRTVTKNGITFIKDFLTQFNEATGEMTDFMNKNLHLNPVFTKKAIYLSFGSTSLQGWVVDETESRVIIPRGETDNEFLTLGLMKAKNEDIVQELIRILQEELDKLGPDANIYCFNAMGYKVPDPSLKRPVQFKDVIGDPNSNYVIEPLKSASFANRMFICPRKWKIEGVEIGGSWASEYAQRTKEVMVDLGGGASYIYDTNGEKGDKLDISSDAFYRNNMSLDEFNTADEELLKAVAEKVSNIITTYAGAGSAAAMDTTAGGSRRRKCRRRRASRKNRRHKSAKRSKRRLRTKHSSKRF